MLSKAALCVAVYGPVSFVLQGCGGGGTTTKAPAPPSTSPAPPPGPTTTTTTTTSTTFTQRTPGWSAQEAVQQLNEMYMGFDASDDASPLGVTISFAGNTSSFQSNLFCHGYADTDCFRGNADCRMSAAVLNQYVGTQPQGSGSQVVPLMGRSIGYVFNQTMAETYFGKCTFLFDGAASLNVNVGCGGTANGGADCSDPHSAFYDMCTDDGTSFHHCVAGDSQVESKKCKGDSYGTMNPPQHQSDPVCYYEMPALIVPYDDPKSFHASQTNHLRDAMKERVQTGVTQDWNEIIIDNRLLIPQINVDPTHTIVAFVYYSGGSTPTATAQQMATAMRDGFQQQYRVNGVGDIPVIEMDAHNDFTQSGGPFKLPTTHSVIA